MNSVIICTHNPRADYLRRTLDALKAQTLPLDHWELLLIDNASEKPLCEVYDLSWHPRGRHVREAQLGLTPARLCGIRHAQGELLVFVDDDNLLARDYLERAIEVSESYPHLGIFGAGALEPEFETPPDPAVQPLLHLLALRSVSRPLWTNNVKDYSCAPHGAGLCVPRNIAQRYIELVKELRTSSVLGRKGRELFCAEDDLFSWLSVGPELGFGIFPELRITHLISAGRVRNDYFIRLVHGHSFSHAILHFLLEGAVPKPVTLLRRLRLFAHLLKNGRFSFRCQRAEMRAEMDAAAYIRQHELEPLPAEKHPLLWMRSKSPSELAATASLEAPAGSLSRGYSV